MKEKTKIVTLEGTTELSNKELIRCLMVTRPDTHAGLYCVYRLTAHPDNLGPSVFDASDEFDGAEEGEEIVLTLALMTEEELAGLGDFDGW
jgi:hypothetical protein